MADLTKSLRRIWQRPLIQVTGVYLAGSWVLLQVAMALEETLELPSWVDQTTLVMLAIGYPLALVIAWLVPANDKTLSDPPAEARAPAAGKPSILVSPFSSLSDDSERSYFAQGMTEDLVAGLSRSRHLQVKSWAVTGGEDQSDLRALGENLGVQYVVDGSVRPMANRVRISVRLSDVTDGANLWADRYDRPIDELFDIQDEVIAQITSAIGATVTKAESTRAAALTPRSLSAWEAVQRASFYRGADGNSEEETNQSIEELRTAVRAEPGYAYAHSMLAWILSYRALNGLSDTPESDYDEATEHLRRGLALAADDPFNLNICGGAAGYLGNYDKSVELCSKALAIDPNFADAYFNLSMAYQHQGRFADAHTALDKAEQMAPDGPMSRYYEWYRANTLAAEGRWTDAEPLVRATIDKAPSYTSPYLTLAGILAEQGRQDEAREVFRRALAVNPKLSLARFARRCEPQQIKTPGRQFIRSLWTRT